MGNRKNDWEGLRALAPNLYSPPGEGGRPSPFSHCGFEAPDGWYELIKELSLKLEPMIAALPDGTREQVRCSQVKSKFGGLRFYMDGPTTEEMRKAIDEAEDLSFKTCEDCGTSASRSSTKGWVHTMCAPCLAACRKAWR